jgi:hypothetical protein
MSAIQKAKYSEPCNNCGICCELEQCPIAELAYPDSPLPCPALKKCGDKMICGLVHAEDALGIDKVIARSLGIGCGCSMPDVGTEEDEIETFNKLSFIKVYGKYPA